MNEITLQEPTLLAEIQDAAIHEGVDATTYVTDAVKYQLFKYRQKRIAAEAEVWYHLPAEQRKQYEGKFVAMLNGEIIGTGTDQVSLLLEMRKRFGKQPILVVEGGDQPMPIYKVVSARAVPNNVE
jgi:hypothetical protein